MSCLQDIRRQPEIHQGQMQMSTEEVTIRYKDDDILKNIDRQIAEIAMKVRKSIIEMQQPLFEAKVKYFATHIPQIVITKRS